MTSTQYRREQPTETEAPAPSPEPHRERSGVSRRGLLGAAGAGLAGLATQVLPVVLHWEARRPLRHHRRQEHVPIPFTVSIKRASSPRSKIDCTSPPLT